MPKRIYLTNSINDENRLVEECDIVCRSRWSACSNPKGRID
jgi:hypothetical protein